MNLSNTYTIVFLLFIALHFLPKETSAQFANDSIQKNNPNYKDSVQNYSFSKNTSNKPLSTFKRPTKESITDSISSRFDSLPGRISNLITNGEITSESSVSNFRHPFIPSDKQYSRLYGHLGVSLFGLPVRGEFYVTSESQNVYNTNYFQLSLDVEQWKKQKLNEFKEKEDLLNGSLSGLQDSLTRLKSRSVDVDHLYTDQLRRTESFKSDLEHIVRSKIDSRRKEITDSLDNVRNLSIELDQNLVQRLDSELLVIESISQTNLNLGDSTQLSRIKQMELIDTVILSRYQKFESKTKELENQKVQFERKSKMLKNKIGEIQEAKQKFDRLRNSNWKSLVSNLSNFRIGTFTPQYSDLTVSNLTVKGIEAGYALKNIGFDIGLGKAMSFNQEFFRNRNARPSYDRNFVGLRYEHRVSKSSKISYAPVGIWDDHNRGFTDFQSNFVNSLAYSFSGKRLKTNLEFAHSSFYETPSIGQEDGIVDQWKTSSFKYELKNNAAAKTKVSYQLNSNLDFKATARVVEPGFRSLGNPFLQRDFWEYETGFSVKWLKNRIESDVMYKALRSNISKLQAVTNRMTGYGIRTRTKFKKYPNIMLSYMPYEQGNNHPDSLYRTRNQLSVLSALITYQKKFEEAGLFISLTAIRSHMEFQQLDNSVKNHLMSLNAQFFTNSWKSGVSITSNQTFPKIDSVNFIGGLLDLSYKINDKTSLQGGSSVDIYNNEAYEYYVFVNFITFAKDHLLIKPNLQIGRIKNLYQISDKRVLSASLTITYRL